MEDNEEKPTLLTADELVRRIDNEGLAYAVTCYYGKNIVCTDDPQMERLWKSAYDSIDALERYVAKIQRP